MISAMKLKRYVTGAGIFGIIISELRHEKKPCPIILLKVDESLEVNFHCTILFLSLAVCLRVANSGEFPLYTKKIA